MRSRSRSEGEIDLIESVPRSARMPAALIGGGRVAVGVAFTVNPVQSVRFLGVDTGTASRISWLARMAAARDIALGVGTLASVVTGRGSSSWLLAGAACDVADGLALAGALSRKQVSALSAGVVIATAIGASAVAIAVVVRGPTSARLHTSSNS